jgi:hypothetical protein
VSSRMHPESGQATWGAMEARKASMATADLLGHHR